jgi:hypothetical protein
LLKLACSQAKKEGHLFSAPPTKDICLICEYLFTNPHRAALVKRAVENNQTRRKIAVARMAQLGEVSMFLYLNCKNDSVGTYA